MIEEKKGEIESNENIRLKASIDHVLTKFDSIVNWYVASYLDGRLSRDEWIARI